MFKIVFRFTTIYRRVQISIKLPFFLQNPDPRRWVTERNTLWEVFSTRFPVFFFFLTKS